MLKQLLVDYIVIALEVESLTLVVEEAAAAFNTMLVLEFSSQLVNISLRLLEDIITKILRDIVLYYSVVNSYRALRAKDTS